MRGARSAPRRDGASDDEPLDETLTIEPLDSEEDGDPPGGRLGMWLASLALTGAGARPSGLARALRMIVVVTLVAATLSVLLDGPALVRANWARLTTALRGAPPIPQLVMTGWREMDALRAPLGATVTYTPDPINPDATYACAVDGIGVQVWQTRSSGRDWLNTLAVSPSPPASSCRVKIALDAPALALVVIYARDPSAPGCERLTLYSSSDGGSTWKEVSPPAYQDACLGDVWPSAHALYYWWTNAQGGQALTGLAHSGNLGKLWNAIPLYPFDPHFSLAPALLDSGSADSIITQVYTWPGPGKLTATAEVWRSLDGGYSWRRALDAPLGARLFSSTEPRQLENVRWPPTYAVVFNAGELSPPWIPDHAPAAIQALNPDGTTWRNVPPLPLPAGRTTQVKPLGITDTLAVGPGGDLLALGQKPGTVATLNLQRELWLWAWDPGAHQWRVGAKAPDGAALVGITWAGGPEDGPYAHVAGAYLWLAGVVSGQQALFSTFIPGQQGAPGSG